MRMTTIKAAAEAARKAREWTARRDELMSKASAEGHSWREIGAACGMSHTGAKRAADRAREREDSLAGPLDKE